MLNLLSLGIVEEIFFLEILFDISEGFLLSLNKYIKRVWTIHVAPVRDQW
jgi:hypothetical protein